MILSMAVVPPPAMTAASLACWHRSGQAKE